MIEFLSESRGNFLAVSTTEKQISDDYGNVFIPKLEQLILVFEKVRVLMLFNTHFKGWELEALRDDNCFGVKHKNEFDKIANAGAPSWIILVTNFGRYFMNGQVKSFFGEHLIGTINRTNKQAL